MSPLLRTLVSLWSLLLLSTPLLCGQESFKYSYVPKSVYKNQLFPVTIIDTRKEKRALRYEFETDGDIAPLSDKPLVIRNGNDSFYTFYFKARGERMVLPRILISDDRETTILKSHTVPVKKLRTKRRDFCGVLAADMKIRNSQVSHYDEQNYLVTFSIEAYEANLEDMKLHHTTESGIEDVVRKGAKAKGEFYTVIPTTQKELNFSYFNTIKQQHISLNTPVELLDNSVVAQTDLNPKDDSFEKLKKYIFTALVGFFFLMFVIYRDFFYLVLGTVSLITLLTFYTPKAKVCIKQGAPLYILPTETSSIGTKIDRSYTTMLLGERKGFRKVEYKNGIIGWIKDEDLCKN